MCHGSCDDVCAPKPALSSTQLYIYIQYTRRPHKQVDLQTQLYVHRRAGPLASSWCLRCLHVCCVPVYSYMSLTMKLAFTVRISCLDTLHVPFAEQHHSDASFRALESSQARHSQVRPRQKDPGPSITTCSCSKGQRRKKQRQRKRFWWWLPSLLRQPAAHVWTPSTNYIFI